MVEKATSIMTALQQAAFDEFRMKRARAWMSDDPQDSLEAAQAFSRFCYLFVDDTSQ